MNFKDNQWSKKIVMIVFTVLLVLVFAGTYMVSYIYNQIQVNKTNAIINEENKEKEVTNLNDTLGVVLTRKTMDDKVLVDFKGKISDFKKEMKVETVTKGNLEEYLKKKGYDIASNTSQEIIFERKKGVLEPNKYYIGSKDGYVAIFKSDENGIAKVEKQEDISGKKVDDLPETDKKLINNFEKKFDNKEDCEEEITNFIS